MRVLLVTITLFLLSSVPLLGVHNGGAIRHDSLSGTIRVTAKNLSVTTRQLGRNGRVSDTTEQVWSLRNRQGRTIGRWLLACRWIDESARLCTTVVKMPLGQLTVTGVSDTPYVGRFAVVGGTGAYDSAGGIAEFTTIGRGKLILVITLS